MIASECSPAQNQTAPPTSHAASGRKALVAALRFLPVAVILAACASGPPTENVRMLGERAEQLQPLTADEGTDARSVVRNALLQDPAVRERASLIGASIDQIVIARSALMPSLRFGIVGGAGAARAGPASLELSGSQLLLDFGGTQRAVEAADVNMQIQYLQFQSRVDEAITEVLRAFGEVAMLEELTRTREEQLAVMQELRGLIAERTESGASPLPDLLEVRNRIERAEFNVLNARLELAEMRDSLLRLSGRSRGGTIPDFPQGCTPPGGETDELQIARLEHVKAELDLEDARRARLPRISLFPLGRLSVSGGGVSVGMNVGADAPLFEGGAIRARQNAARNRLQSVEAQVETAERNIRLDDLRLRRQISSLTERQAMLRRQINLQRQTRDLYRGQYFELGTRQMTDLLDAEETLFSRQIELIEANFESRLRSVECAARSKSLRRTLGLTTFQIHDYPLTTDGL
ncbi:MAG: TolC family protein [Roseovarius sp.]|nr:TolC family protein [Roseovarius sp.]